MRFNTNIKYRKNARGISSREFNVLNFEMKSDIIVLNSDLDENMIQLNSDNQSSRPRAKAVGLISGGLDSTVAARIIKDLQVEVHGVYFAMPWGCCDKGKAQAAADTLGIPLVVLQLDERYLKIVENPKYGYGSALNPCVDCRIHMFSRAKQYMESIGADFVFTGEVLGQRQMSQMRHSMKWVEEGTGLKGRLLRPLCAQLLEPTIPETDGLIDRAQLLRITGRSRSEQRKLAENFAITDYPNPAGGCLLTDKNFARKMKDTFKHGYRNFRETVALKWGRHFRINEQFKIILGRNEEENAALKAYAHPDDHIMEISDKVGPTLILKGYQPTPEIFAIAAGLIKKYSRHKDSPDQISAEYWPVKDKNTIRSVQSRSLTENYIEQISI